MIHALSLITRVYEGPNLAISFSSPTASHRLMTFPIYTTIAAMISNQSRASDAPKYPLVGLFLSGAPFHDHALLVRTSVHTPNIPRMPL